MSLTAKRLREVLKYDPSTGDFTWLVASRNTKVGTRAGYFGGSYVQIGVDGKLYLAHRLAWLFVHGDWPHEIDHANGQRHDNRLANLRLCTRSENNQNLGIRADNKSGFRGVWWNRANRCWSSQITIAGKRHNVGNFPAAEDAYAAYLKAKQNLHEFQPVPREKAIA